MDQYSKEFYEKKFWYYQQSVKWAEKEFYRILDGIDPAFCGDNPGLIFSAPDLRIHSDGKGHSQVITICYNSKDADEDRLMLLASMLQGNEELGWDDLDAVEWTVKAGFGFHGIPSSIPKDCFQGWGNEDADWTHISYLTIQCTDYAS